MITEDVRREATAHACGIRIVKWGLRSGLHMVQFWSTFHARWIQKCCGCGTLGESKAW